MAYLNTVIKRATGGPRLSYLCGAATARTAAKAPIVASVQAHMIDAHEHPRNSRTGLAIVIAPTASRTFGSESNSKRDDVPRTATGEVQKQTNFASEVGKKMQEVAPGGDPAESASSGKGEQSKQERDKGGSK